jgi:hypothetical protein
MKKLFFAMCLLLPLSANAECPVTYSEQCLSEKLQGIAVFDGNYSDSIRSAKMECATHGEYFIVSYFTGKPDGGNRARFDKCFMDKSDADKRYNKNLSYVTKWKDQPNFWDATTFTRKTF